MLTRSRSDWVTRAIFPRRTPVFSSAGSPLLAEGHKTLMHIHPQQGESRFPRVRPYYRQFSFTMLTLSVAVVTVDGLPLQPSAKPLVQACIVTVAVIAPTGNMSAAVSK